MLLNLLQCHWRIGCAAHTFQSGVFPSNAFGNCSYRMDVPVSKVHRDSVSSAHLLISPLIKFAGHY